VAHYGPFTSRLATSRELLRGLRDASSLVDIIQPALKVFIWHGQEPLSKGCRPRVSEHVLQGEVCYACVVERSRNGTPNLVQDWLREDGCGTFHGLRVESVQIVEGTPKLFGDVIQGWPVTSFGSLVGRAIRIGEEMVNSAKVVGHVALPRDSVGHLTECILAARACGEQPRNLTIEYTARLAPRLRPRQLQMRVMEQPGTRTVPRPRSELSGGWAARPVKRCPQSWATQPRKARSSHPPAIAPRPPGGLLVLLSWLPLVGHPGTSAVAPPTETRRAVTLTFCGDVLGGGPPESWFLWDVQFGGN